MDSLRSTNHLPPNFIPKPARKRRRAWKWVILGVIILGALAWGGQYLLSRTNQIFTNNTNIFSRLGGLIISDDKPLIGEDQGVVNVLLLGYGGPGHEGPYLTDTMIVASINVKTQDVILTSIPRDFWVKLGSLGESKINAAYAYNISDTDPNAAGKAAIAAAEQVTGLNIPYFAAIDFQGFVKAVDHVGGLDITVDNSFTDDEYPDSNYGYMPVSFTKGPDHMDGARALIFARSRHGNNGEGSDFARSERQKKILLALKDKVFQLDLTDLKTMNNLLSDFTENFRTNLEPYELKRLGTLTQDISGDKVYSFSLEPQSNIICNGSIYLDPKTQKEVPAPSIAEPTPSDIAAGTTDEVNAATPNFDSAHYL
jgi:LCP family protein required for cell wall assembly